MSSGGCAIISGGEYSSLVGIEKADYIICCDKGLEYALKNAITPDLAVGDFDSFSGCVPEGIPVLRLPVEKDDTDTVSAVRFACSKGFDRITLYCALGGRLDHLFSNIQTLSFAVEHGAQACIISADTCMYAFSDDTVHFPSREGWSLSVFSLSGECSGVSIKGAKYCLENAALSSAFPLGVSNCWENDIEVGVKQGIILVMLCRMP